jgi:hypothetical protein
MRENLNEPTSTESNGPAHCSQTFSEMKFPWRTRATEQSPSSFRLLCGMRAERLSLSFQLRSDL